MTLWENLKFAIFFSHIHFLILSTTNKNEFDIPRYYSSGTLGMRSDLFIFSCEIFLKDYCIALKKKYETSNSFKK